MKKAERPAQPGRIALTAQLSVLDKWYLDELAALTAERSGCPPSATQLAKRLDRSAAHVSRVLGRLFDHGYVRLTVDGWRIVRGVG